LLSLDRSVSIHPKVVIQMANAQLKLVGNILTVSTDLTKELEDSKSGKTVIVGKTEGDTLMVDDKKYGVTMTVYRFKTNPKW
jgi:hypothetical protein